MTIRSAAAGQVGGFIGLAMVAAAAIAAPPQQIDLDCWREWNCAGLAQGHCEISPLYMGCLGFGQLGDGGAVTCGDPSNQSDGCNFEYVWDCYWSCGDWCAPTAFNGMGGNCGSRCVQVGLVCSCECASPRGPIEDGFYSTCRGRYAR
jgi:hypothetical protein